MDVSEKFTLCDRMIASGNLGQARSLYNDILSEFPASDRALVGIAIIDMQGSKLEQAMRMLASALKINPSSERAIARYAMCLAELGDWSAAEDYFDKLKDFDLQEPTVLDACGYLYAKGRYQAAFSLFPAKRNVSDLAVQLKVKILRCIYAVGEVKRYVVSKARDSGFSGYVFSALNLSVEVHDFQTALNLFADIYKGQENSAKLNIKGAELSLLARDLDAAKKYLNMATKIGPLGVDGIFLNAKVLRLERDYKGATSALLEYVKFKEVDGEAWRLLFEVCDLNYVPEALTRIKKVMEKVEVDNHNRFMMLYAVADAYERLLDLGAAFDYRKSANSLQRQELIRANQGYDSLAVRESLRKISKLYSDVGVPASLRGAKGPIFIVGMPRSGTTLVERVLKQVTGVVAVGESEAMELLVGEYHQMLQKNQYPLPGRLTELQRLELRQKYLSVFCQDECVLIDKMPHNFQHVGFIMTVFPDAKVIQMRRDPMDVCLSIYERPFPAGHNYACDFKDVANFYANVYSLMDVWSARFPSRVIDVKYEDLVLNPAEKFKSLFEFCSLAWTPDVLNLSEDKSPAFTFSEMQVVGKVVSERVGRWRNFYPDIDELKCALISEGVDVR